ncbi:MAG: DoxX family protein [Bacteroidota bacterium]
MSNLPLSKSLNLLLWIAQGLVAATLLWGGCTKLFTPETELAALWPWTADVSPAFVKFTGIVDLLAAVGLILPAALRIQPKLTPAAALGVVLLMIAASVFHISRGEGSSIGINIFVGVLAGFIAWGRRYTYVSEKVHN